MIQISNIGTDQGSFSWKVQILMTSPSKEHYLIYYGKVMHLKVDVVAVLGIFLHAVSRMAYCPWQTLWLPELPFVSFSVALEMQ